MKLPVIWLFAAICIVQVAHAQNWQDCKADGGYSFSDLKEAVYRVTSSQMYSGWDEKIFNRSGDLASVAILQSLTDKEMASPEAVNMVLSILNAAFACPDRCVSTASERQPRVTLLLLDRLYERNIGKLRDKIADTRGVIEKQALSGEAKAESAK
jgi:hypothetical protein